MGRRGASDAILNMGSSVDTDEMCYFCSFLFALSSLLISIPIGMLLAFIFDSISIFLSFSQCLAIFFFVFFASSLRMLCYDFFSKESIAIDNIIYSNNPPKYIYKIKEFKKSIFYSIFAIIGIIVIEVSIFFY